MALPRKFAQQVRSLNCLMAAATGSERDKTLEVERAIEFGIRSPRTPVSTAPFAIVAQRLFDIHNASREASDMQHFAVGSGEHHPLWLRERVRGHLRRLRRHRDGLLLVTGLKQAICEPSGRFTSRRQREYERATALVYDEVARASAPKQRIHVIVL